MGIITLPHRRKGKKGKKGERKERKGERENMWEENMDLRVESHAEAVPWGRDPVRKLWTPVVTL